MDNVDRSPTKSVDAPNAMGRWNATRCIGTQATTFFAILAMAALAGCQVRKYELEMTPRDGQLERKLTVYEQRADGNQKVDLPVEHRELARLAAQYHVDVPKTGGPKHSFSKRFAGRLPDDVGGFGTYTHWTTSLGSTTAYVERVRGDDDAAANLEKRRVAVQRLVGLLIGWVEKEFAGTPELPKLRGFLEHEFCRDLVNLSIYMKSLEFVAEHDRYRLSAGQKLTDQKDGVQILTGHSVRIGQYFIERGYLTPDQLPDWFYAIDQAEQKRPGRLVALIQRWFASRIEVPAHQPIPASLARLNDAESVLASMRTFLQSSDDYRALVKKWEQTPETQRGNEPPDPSQVLGELVVKAFVPGGVFLGGHELSATLAVPREPLTSNGRWNAEKHQVEWKTTLVPNDRSEDSFPMHRPLPDVLFAIWVEPAAEKQIMLFGKVALNDHKLAQYCLWRRGLPEEKARQWEAFLDGLKPGADLIERITGFRFADELDDGGPPNASREIREVLVAELK